MKSNPQLENNDIAVLVYKSFTLGIFNIQTSKKLHTQGFNEDVTLYRVDKDDRKYIQTSQLHTLDSSNRIISWNLQNGAKQKIMTIPNQINVSPQSCLNSEEKLVLTWDNNNVYVIDFSSSSQNITVANTYQLLKPTGIVDCQCDKINRRMFIFQSNGDTQQYDIASNQFSFQFSLSQFYAIQSSFISKNLITISYQQSSQKYVLVSFRQSQMIFSQILPNATSNVMVSSLEQYITVSGASNLFQVWDVQKNQKVFEPDFQNNIYCDDRDSNQTIVNSTINFVHSSIDSEDQVVSISDYYIFAYSLKEQRTILFKSYSFGIEFWFAYIFQDKITLCSSQSISILDIKSSKFTYLVDNFYMLQSAYDFPIKIEVDPDLNRIIKIDQGGYIQYWSYFDNTLEKYFFASESNPSFFLDKQLNKLVQYSLLTTAGLDIIFIFDYRQGILLDSIQNAFPESNLQNFYLQQDKTNGYLIGIISTSQYMIYNFDSSFDHSLIFKGTFLPNATTKGIALFLEEQKQLFIYINGILYLFNYFYSNADYNTNIPFDGKNINFDSFYFNLQTQILFNFQEQQIMQYKYNVNSLDLIQTINYNTDQIKSIYLIELLNIFLVNKVTQVSLKNYVTYQEQVIDFKQDNVNQIVFDDQKAIVIIITNSYKLMAIDLKTTNLLSSIQIQPQLIQQIQIDTHQLLVIISYDSGDILLYNYNILSIVSIFNNMKKNTVDYLIDNYSTLTTQSESEIYTKRLANFGQIAQITPNNGITDFHIHQQSGLTFVLSNQQVHIYNHINNQYLPSFPDNINLSYAYIIRGIPSQDTILIGFLTPASNTILVFKLSDYSYITTMNHNIEQCNQVAELYYDDFSKRLFSACDQPGTVIVWDANNQYSLIKILDQIVSVYLVSGIAFYPEQNQIMIIGYAWWSVLVDYQSLNKICSIMGIFGNFDYINKYQFMWDHIGYIRQIDMNCKYISIVQAHKQWIFEVLIDSYSFILTSISEDQFVKTWSYTNGIQLMSELQLQNALHCGVLDLDNNVVIVGDFKGFIYILNIYLDQKYNLILLGSSDTIKYFNIIEFLVPNVYSNSFRILGILSTLQTDQGVIFHSVLNLIQLWNYSNQQLRYGFLTLNWEEIKEVQSKIIRLLGQNNIGVLLLREKTLFFDINNLNLVNVQKLQCKRNTQLTSYFICSQLNIITIINLINYEQIQNIQIDPNTSIIQLESINELNSFFVTTTLGGVISFQLNDKTLLFEQQFIINLLQQAIVNYCFTQLKNIYIILMAAFDGNIAYIKFNPNFVILEQQILTLKGQKSHAHILKIQNSQVFIKRINDFYIGLYSLEDFNQVNQIQSPCLGYVYKIDFFLEHDYILQSCVGVYQINMLSNFKYIGMGRFSKNLKLADVYTIDQNQIILINNEYFIDSHQDAIYIYKINLISQKIIMMGQFTLDGRSLGNVSNYEIVNTLDNIYVKLILYSEYQLGQLQLPIYGEQTCKENLYQDQIAQTLSSIESVYYKIQSYFKINQMNLAQNGGSIYVSLSTQTIQDSKFEQDSSSNNGGSIYSTQSNLLIQSTVFYQCSSLNGGCIYADNGSLNITQVQSKESNSTKNGGFLFISQISILIVKDSNFQNCTAYYDGGCFYIQKSGDNKSMISNSSFQQSTAYGSGGAILLDTSNFYLKDSNFQQNRAGIGGAIRYLNTKPSFMLQNEQIKITNKDSCKTYYSNTCKQNKAIIFGDSIASYPQYASVFPSNYFNVDISHYPNITFSNFRSGLSNFDLNIQFLDEFKKNVNQIDFQNSTLSGQLSQNLLQEIRQYSCRVYITENQDSFQKQIIKIEGATSIDYTFQNQNFAACLMNNFKIAGVPTQNATIYLQLQGMKQIGASNTFKDVDNIQIEIQFRSCITGEYYTPSCDGCQIQECTQCQKGSYSLVAPQTQSQIQCKPCDLSVAQSCQLDQIDLKQNYWRSSRLSDSIYECDAFIQPCNGDEQSNYCTEGYIGGLCQACDNHSQEWGTRYGAVLSLYDKGVACMKCSDIQANYFKQVLIFISVLIYIVILMVDSQNSNCKLCQIHTLKQAKIVNLGVSSYIFQSSTIAKIFINQFQVFASLQQNIGITFPTLFSNLISFPTFSSQPVYIFIYSLDCTLSSFSTTIPIQYLRFLYLSIFLPIIMLFAIMLFIKGILFILTFHNPNQFYNNNMYNSKSMVVSSLIVFMYLAIQNIYQAALQIIFCVKLDGQYYMKGQMNQICYTEQHYTYLSFLIGPILFIITIFYPLILFYLIYHNNHSLFIQRQIITVRRYGYIISGLKNIFSAKNQQKIKEYLLKNNYSLYILMFKPDHQSMQVFKNWKRLRQMLQSINGTIRKQSEKKITLNNLSLIHHTSYSPNNSPKADQTLLNPNANGFSNQLLKNKSSGFKLKTFKKQIIKDSIQEI
ncbi:hypothetical protein ABPG74_016883 [Tetrahymena malaccensis]